MTDSAPPTSHCWPVTSRRSTGSASQPRPPSAVPLASTTESIQAAATNTPAQSSPGASVATAGSCHRVVGDGFLCWCASRRVGRRRFEVDAHDRRTLTTASSDRAGGTLTRCNAVPRSPPGSARCASWLRCGVQTPLHRHIVDHGSAATEGPLECGSQRPATPRRGRCAYLIVQRVTAWPVRSVIDLGRRGLVSAPGGQAVERACFWTTDLARSGSSPRVGRLDPQRCLSPPGKVWRSHPEGLGLARAAQVPLAHRVTTRGDDHDPLQRSHRRRGPCRPCDRTGRAGWQPHCPSPTRSQLRDHTGVPAVAPPDWPNSRFLMEAKIATCGERCGEPLICRSQN